MRRNQLIILTSGLLLQAIGSVAFQLQVPDGRKTIHKIAHPGGKSTVPKLSPASHMLGLRSKLKRFDIIPRIRKSSASKIPKKTAYSKSNKQILALVTTCCLTWLARPRPARAVTVFMDYVMDPTTLTYAEIPPMAMLLDGVPRRNMMTFNLGLLGALLSRKTLKFFASAVVVASLVSWMYVGLVYYIAFLASRKDFGTMEDGESAHDAGDTMTVKDAKHFNFNQARHVNWAEYSHGLFGPPSVVKEKAPTKHGLTAKDDAVLQKAALFFQEQKQKLHNHPTHVRSEFGSSAYLNNLAINNEPSHDVSGHYLDTLSGTKKSTWAEYKQQLTDSQARQVKKDQVGDKLQIMKNLLTWDDYKHLVNELQDRKHEVSELKQEVLHLQNLLQIEQSIHHVVPDQEHEPMASKDQKTIDELKRLEWLTEKYNETIQESLAQEVQDDYHLGSGIK